MLDRISIDLSNYCPNNVTFATITQQKKETFCGQLKS